jgi:sulfide:quinone oxidoreductase
MAKRLVILGGGTGGTLLANHLRRRLDEDELQIDVVDRDDLHLYQPGLLFVPFGLADPAEIVRPRQRQLHRGIRFHEQEIDSVSIGDQRVRLGNGSSLDYDVLVVASGSRLMPEETEGLTWSDSVHTFYDLDGATKLRDALARFDGGRLVVDIVDMPIKCPVAPIEFAFLADWFLRERGVRDRTQLTLATPLDGCFTKPVASKHLTYLLDEKEIGVEVEFSAGEVDGDGGRLISYDGREIPFDLLVTVPLHGGAEFVERSAGLGDSLGFVPTDPHTLQADAAPNVFAIGDATDLPTSKAGSVTHFEGEVLAENVERFLAGRDLVSRFDGHANCFIETGFHKALLIDFDYEHEPLPGHFGPLPLLKESRLNHLAKLAFQPIYWHALLPARPLPMPTRRVAA